MRSRWRQSVIWRPDRSASPQAPAPPTRPESAMTSFENWLDVNCCYHFFFRYTKNKVNAPKAGHERIMQRAVVAPPKTDYQATYTHKNLRPRSTKRPPPSPRDRNPPPMQMSTVQRDEFVSKFDQYEGPPASFKKVSSSYDMFWNAYIT